MTESSQAEVRMAGLMRQALGGDELAYAAFLRDAAGLVRRAVQRKVAGQGAISTEDIVQEVLLAVHLKRQTWRSAEPILPWLYAIARYKMVDVYRRHGHRVHLSIDDLADVLPAPPVDPTREREVQGAIESLPSGQQRVVRSIGLQGQSIADTARALSMQETAVRVAFHRGLSALRTRFGNGA